ncbi:MAG: ribonuclease HI family protein [Chloroflexi bacterium]|nr:ribonuclease HI family protein [Chloroflexota bacterium]
MTSSKGIEEPDAARSNRRRLVAMVDGASRGNPGEAALGVVVSLDGKAVIRRIGQRLGLCTNNRAEYLALIRTLEEAVRLNADELVVFMDSQLVVQQMNGAWKVRDPGLVPLKQQADTLVTRLPKVTFAWNPRAMNREADRLANEALDGRPVDFSFSGEA